MKSDINTPSILQPLAKPSRGLVKFDEVSFSYPSRSQDFAIRDFSLEIKEGEHVAIVGPSGAGKSTLYQLLLRFYNPQLGSISVDGVDILEVDPRDVRGLMAIVPQECVIFGDSARENIRFGRPEATDEEVVFAAKAASAHEFLNNLPERYDTYLGERGARLSGGQKQRIAIARAILADPTILLLDEATSALDSESEQLVQGALRKLQKSRTTLVIAHRLATVLEADRIVVLEKGRIVDIGPHEDLLLRNATYAQMFNLQFGHPESSTHHQRAAEGLSFRKI